MPFISALMMLSPLALVAGQVPEALLPSDTVYAQGLTETTLEESLSLVRGGDVILLGEQHGTQAQALQQTYVIETLKKKGLKVSVGMEFFNYTQQGLVDAWRAGRLSESEFLRQIGWGAGFSFDAYRRQLQATSSDGFIIALNAPRSLTSKVAKTGLGSLTEPEIQLLPPGLQVGNSKYLKRFKQAIGHVSDPTMIENYFMAQSIWDDTMAWRAAEFLMAHPNQVLVVIVGEFHVQYGGGLPDRMKARNLQNLTTFSLVNLQDLSESEQASQVRPSVEYGPRADFIWTSRVLSH